MTTTGEPTEVPTEARHKALRGGLEWVAVMVGAVLIAFLIKTFLIQAFYIPSESMLDTLHKNDRVLVNKLSYRLHDVNRGDVVVFERLPEGPGDTTKDLIKRVIALEGETVEGRDGRVFVDGRPLSEPYLDQDGTTTGFAPQRIPPAHVWVMGDNRPNSKDSRVFGPISDSKIVGRAFIRVWPVAHITFM